MENDKLFDCAAAYLQNSEYEYKIELYNSGTINETSFVLNKSHFMHLSGLEKLSDIINQSEISSAELLDKILNGDITYQNISESSFWGEVFNNPQKNGVTYTLDDRIDTLTNFREVLSSGNVKAYSWDSNCHRTHRPYNSEIAADFMLVFESENKKTSDERIYAFFKLDKNNPNIAHGVSQFPTDRTYNDDGRTRVPEITIMSFIEHDKVNNVDRVITELPAEEQQRLISEAAQRSVNSVVAKDLRQLKGKRYKYFTTQTEAARNAYEHKLEIFGRRSPYTNEMLKEAENRLAAQSQDIHNSDVKDLIIEEIELIKNELAIREKNPELPSGIQVAKFVRHNDGTISVTEPIATIKIPQAVIKTTSAIKRAAHFVRSSAADFVSDIKETLKKAVSKPNKKVPERKRIKSQPVKHEHKLAQPTVSPIHEKKSEREKEPLFSVAEISSDKYAPTSSKDKDIGINKKNDLEL